VGEVFGKVTAPAQQDLRLRPEKIVTGLHNAFYTKLAALLEKVSFTETVHRICVPHYRLASREGGRPTVDPAVLMRMLIVGFPEGIGSERGIASCCADSLAIRRFLGYSLTEETPDHSTFTGFRRRLPVKVLRPCMPRCCARSGSMDFCAAGTWALMRRSTRPTPVSAALSAATARRATGNMSAGSLPILAWTSTIRLQ
jgi:hypothetical protein